VRYHRRRSTSQLPMVVKREYQRQCPVGVSPCPVEVQESTAAVPLSLELLLPTPPRGDYNLAPKER